MPRTHSAEEEEDEEDEDPIRTPGRKRRKVMAIAPSDASSSVDSISPGKYPNSTPRRRRIRLGTPLSASRRRSAPCNSPSKLRSPERMEQIFVKEERIVSHDIIQYRNLTSNLGHFSGLAKGQSR
jgi:hypothetical protein